MPHLQGFFLLLGFLLFSSPSLAAFDSAELPTSGELSIEQITPEGEDVPPGRQIAITFNRPVVAIGKMERTAAELPITITPALVCQWRWISTRALACNLGDKQRMLRSTQYRIEIRPGIKTLDNVTIDKPYLHSFITRRPEIRDEEFRLWKTPELPLIRVYWDQAVGKRSVQQHLYFEDADHRRVAAVAAADTEKRYLPESLPLPGEKLDVATDEEGQVSDDEKTEINGEEFRRVWIVQPVESLPADQTIALKVEPGILPAEGDLPGVENRLVREFDTFPAFVFVGLHCYSNADKEILIKPGEVQQAADYCNPLRPHSLQFTAPVARKQIRDHAVFSPSVGGKDGVSAWKKSKDDDEAVSFPHERGRTYGVWLPAGLKAAQTYTVTIPGDTPQTVAIEDKFGRKLRDAATVSFTTDHRLPNFILEYGAAILEKSSDSDVPVYVNNLVSLNWQYNRLTAAGAQKGLSRQLSVPAVMDVQFSIPLGIRDLLDHKAGALWGWLYSSPPVLRHIPPEIFAEVTPFQVHAKLGHFNSLIWVIDMATGQPVADADIILYKDTLGALNGPADNEITARTNADGIAILPGTESFDPDLIRYSGIWEKDKTRFFVQVRKGEDIALLPIWDPFEIDSYRSTGTSFHPSSKRKFGHIVTWGTTAQGIYHPGDTIQYKFYVRNQNNQTLTPAPRTDYWLEIVDPTGKTVQKVRHITLSEFGSASGEFLLGKKALTGWYDFRLMANFSGKPIHVTCDDDSSSTEEEDSSENNPVDCNEHAEFTWTPLRVLVSDFTPIPFQVRNNLNGDLFHPGDKIEISSDAKLHSGGPYTQAQTRVTAILTPSPFTPKTPAAADFIFGSGYESAEPQQLFQITGQLDAKGEYQANFTIDDRKIYHGRLMVESAVQDDRGKNVAHQSYADYAGAERFAGLRLSKRFYQTGEDIAPDYIVTDERGSPLKDVPVTLSLERKERKGARVKSAGDSYLAETETSIIKEAECQGMSDSTSKTCHLKAATAGEYTLKATVTDTKGRQQITAVGVWVSGHDYVFWDNGSDAYLEIIADKDSYHIGDTAHYFVKNPYPGAKALVTVERYGVLDHFLTTLKDSTAVIDIPIKPDYLPGFFLSVIVMSPRVEKPLEAGQVDLGKPAFRLGYARADVRDSYKEITVTATPAQAVYRPGDTVHVDLVAAANHPNPGEPVELAVAVLDEAVFDLIAQGRAYYDPYAGFYTMEGIDLRNYSLLTRLIGRQKFEKKGANPGGDGGASLNMRTIFKYVSYWNPGLKTDADGRAAIDFKVPDNLTGWRILVIADTPTDRLGLGEANIKVNRPTEIRPEMPNQVAERDQFEARFSVMNRANTVRTITARIAAEGDIDPSAPAAITKTFPLKPYERALVALPVKVGAVRESRATEQGEIRFTVEAGDESDTDGLKHPLPVLKLRSLDVAANYGTTVSDKISEAIHFPENIFTDVGSLSVTLAPTVIGNLEGAFKYIRDYPYPCWEQVLTRGVMASHFKNLQPYMPATLRWPGHESLPQQTLARAGDYQAPNGGMTYFVSTDDHTDPYLSAYTALAFNWLRHSGYAIPEAVETKLHQYLQTMLRHDELPSFYTEGMSSTVRAVALAALAENRKVDRSDLERYAPFLKQMSLFGKTHFAAAALQIPGGQSFATDAAKMILAQSNQTGGKFIFQEELDDSYARILSSPLRENCAILDLLTAMGETPEARTLASDIPFKLVRTITQTRGGRDHWENTQENMFCMNALVDYSRVYEKDKPVMAVTASLDQKPFGEAKFVDFRDPVVTLDRPIEAGDVGRQATMDLQRTGTGRLYYATRLAYAPRESREGDSNAGIEVHREYSLQMNGEWTLLAKPFAVRQGNLVRVDLYVSLSAARNFVVVDDPIPGGFEPVNADLANTSKVDAAKGEYQAAGGSIWFRYNDWEEYDVSFWSFNHRELLHQSARFYSDYLPAGNYHLSYMVQAIGAGNFAIMPTMAAEMYDPDVYGKTTFEQLTVSTNQPTPAP